MLCVAIVFTADVVLKYLAYTNTLPSLHWLFFDVAHFANPGIALSIPLPLPITLTITAFLLSSFLWLAFQKNTVPAARIACISILLGAISNFVDRMITGTTTDYLIFFTRGAINLADVLIVCGIMGCLWYHERADTRATRTNS